MLKLLIPQDLGIRIDIFSQVKLIIAGKEESRSNFNVTNIRIDISLDELRDYLKPSTDKTYKVQANKFLSNIDRITYILEASGEVLPLLQNPNLFREVINLSLFNNLLNPDPNNMIPALIRGGNLHSIRVFEEKFGVAVDKNKFGPELGAKHPELLATLEAEGWNIDHKAIFLKLQPELLPSLLEHHPLLSAELSVTRNKAVYLMKQFPAKLALDQYVADLIEKEPGLIFQPFETGETLLEICKTQSGTTLTQQYIHHRYLLSLYKADTVMLSKFLQAPDFDLSVPKNPFSGGLKEVALAWPRECPDMKSVIDLIITKGAFDLLHEILTMEAINFEVVLSHAIEIAHIISYGNEAEKDCIGFKNSDFKQYHENVIKTLKLLYLERDAAWDANIDPLLEYCARTLADEELVTKIIQVLFMGDTEIFGHICGTSTLHDILAANNKIDIMINVLLDHFRKLTDTREEAQHATLKFCVEHNYIQLADLMIHNGFNPNAADKLGEPILSTLIQNGELLPEIMGIVNFLLHNGAKALLGGCHSSAFHSAATIGRVDILARLLDACAEEFQSDDISQDVGEVMESILAFSISMPKGGSRAKYGDVISLLAERFPVVKYMVFDGQVEHEIEEIFRDLGFAQYQDHGVAALAGEVHDELVL